MIAVRDTTSGIGLTDVVEGLRYSNINPGGFESCSFTVPADRRPSYGSMIVLSDPYGTIWQGRVEENDLDVGDADRRGVTAYGSGMLLKKTLDKEIFVSVDMSLWGEASVANRIALEGGGYMAGSSTLQPDETTGQAALVFTATGDWSASGLPHPMARLDTNGIPIGSIYYAWKKSASVDHTLANWNWDVLAGNDDIDSVGTYDTSGNLKAAGPGTGTLTTTTSTRVFGRIALYYSAAGGGAGVEYSVYFTCVGIYGRHGLTKRGSEDATTAKGLYGGDIVQNLIGRVDGVGIGQIDAPTYVVQDLAFLERTDIESMIVELNKLFGYDWGTWDSGNLFDTEPKFSWTAKQTTPKWTIRRSDCERINLSSSLSQLADTVYVKYRTVTGQAKELTATTSVRALADAGMTGQAASIGDGSLVTADNAQQQADTFFSLQGQDPPMSGTIDITGEINLASGGSRPAYHMRADGALLRIEDLLPVTEVYDLSDLRQSLLPIKRVEVDASGDTPRTSVSVDQTSEALSVLQAKLISGVAAAGLAG